MKKIIALIIALMFVTTSYAEETIHEEAACIRNQAGGIIYLRKDLTVIASSSIENNVMYITGRWEMAGNTLIMITWDDKTHTALPKSAFVICNL